MPLPGQVYQIQPNVMSGPWLDRSRQHRGLVISNQSSNRDGSIIVAPMTGTRPIWQNTHVEVTTGVGDISPPMWILCEYLVSVPQTIFGNERPIGVFASKSHEMSEVRRVLAYMFRIMTST